MGLVRDGIYRSSVRYEIDDSPIRKIGGIGLFRYGAAKDILKRYCITENSRNSSRRADADGTGTRKSEGAGAPVNARVYGSIKKKLYFPFGPVDYPFERCISLSPPSFIDLARLFGFPFRSPFALQILEKLILMEPLYNPCVAETFA